MLAVDKWQVKKGLVICFSTRLSEGYGHMVLVLLAPRTHLMADCD